MLYIDYLPDLSRFDDVINFERLRRVSQHVTNGENNVIPLARFNHRTTVVVSRLKHTMVKNTINDKKKNKIALRNTCERIFWSL